jgi:organic hydroperoxide reductase OsmC/OhrA
MNISATVIDEDRRHRTILRTDDKEQYLMIPAKDDGPGSSVNGGELLFLALATCYCNDIYREAKQRGLRVESVEVEVTGEFGGRGEPAKNISYRASIKANGTREEVLALMRHTDSVAEIQNTLRRATPVALTACQVVEAKPTGDKV